jgi:regulator of RNase E activity RraB
MTQAKMNGFVQYVLIALLVTSMVFNLYAIDRPVEVNVPETNLSVPTAEEIAAMVEIPSVDLSQLSEVYKKIYAEEYDLLESEALEAYDEEYKIGELEDFLKETILGFDKLRSVSLDDDETEVVILNLGVNDKEDSLVEVTKVYNIRYELDDSTSKLKGKVLVKALVTYDEDDGYEAELTYSL